MLVAQCESVDYAQSMKASWFLIALLWAGSSAAAVYKWVDTEGVVHYGDSPPTTGAKPIDLPEVSRYQSRQLPTTSSPRTGAPAGAFKGYDSLVISRPENDETVRSNEGLFTVSLALSPGLQGGHRLQLFLDGRLVAENVGSSVQLKGVARGTHELTAVVVDEDGKEWVRSSPVRFYLHKVSLLNKPAVIGPETPPADETGNDANTDTDGGTENGTDTDTGDGADGNGGDGAGTNDTAPAAPASPYSPSYAPSYTP